MSSFPTPAIPGHLITVRVGLALLYCPHSFEKNMDHDQAFLAHVVHVNTNGTVNIILANEIGIQSRRINVPVVQGRAAVPGECAFPAA